MCRRHEGDVCDVCFHLRWICSIPKYYISVWLPSLPFLLSFVSVSVDETSQIPQIDSIVQHVLSARGQILHTHTEKSQGMVAVTIFNRPLHFSLTEGWTVQRAAEDAAVNQSFLHNNVSIIKCKLMHWRRQGHLLFPLLFAGLYHPAMYHFSVESYKENLTGNSLF